jgi:hypothetical protein
MGPSFAAMPSPIESAPAAATPPFGSYGPAAAATFAQPTFGWGGVSTGMPTLAPGPLGTPLVIPDGVTAPHLIAAIALRRGQPQGPASDHDVEEFIYDAVELLSGAAEVEVRCEGGRVALTGSVPHKRLKRDIGELAWAIPGINDVNNSVTITTRRRTRAFARDTETQQGGTTSRKQV